MIDDSDVVSGSSVASDDEVEGHQAEPIQPQPGTSAEPTSTNGQTAPAPSGLRPDLPSLMQMSGSTSSNKWRTTTQKLIQLSKSSSGFSGSTVAGPGAEPGVDPRRPSSNEMYAKIREDCSIQIVDYSGTNATFLKADNQGLIHFLNSAEGARPSWSKVRWINIGGISWDVISALALKYDLHPLAVEDVLHGRRTSISKAEYFSSHLFISTLCHAVMNANVDSTTVLGPDGSPITAAPGVMSPSQTRPSTDQGPTLPPPVTSSSDKDKNGWLPGHLGRVRSREDGHVVPDELPPAEEDRGDGVDWIYESIEVPGGSENHEESQDTRSIAPEQAKHLATTAFVNHLKGDDRVHVEVTPVYVFLLRDGTFISIYRKTHDKKVFGVPILRRLQSPHTLLRRSSDPSLLLQAVLDYIVDKGLQIVDSYHERILGLEREILIIPKMRVVRAMHILSGDLTLHRRTLEPLKNLAYGLRRYDLDRCKALAVSKDSSADTEKVRGYMSHQAKVYLADVVDHMDYILSSFDMFSSITENLIGFSFNTISYQTNEAMRRLSLATIIFFPLTFLTGYFGMNFTRFWSINNNSDVFFWWLAIPIMVIFTLVWCWNDLQRLAHVVSKKSLQKRIEMEHMVELVIKRRNAKNQKMKVA